MHQVGLLHLLRELYSDVFVPAAVAAELDRGLAMGIELPDVRTIGWIKIRHAKGLEKVPPEPKLGAGEKEVLALGLHFLDVVLVLDERLARLQADALGLTYTGTMGILIRAKQEGRIPQIAPVLEQLDKLDLRLSDRTRATVLQLAGE